MLIEQIVKKQTVSILDIILQSQSPSSHNQQDGQNQKVFTSEEYVSFYESKGIIKQDEGKILLILINKYLENEKSNNQFQNLSNTFTEDEAYSMLKFIKKSILEPNPSLEQKKNKITSSEKPNQLKQNSNKKQTYRQRLQQNSNQAQGNKKSHRQAQKGTAQEQNQFHLNSLSKKLKKQNQFITRNIDRIKKYATNFSESTLPLQRSQLEQIKISHQISHKLFNLYKPIYPSGMSNNKQIEMNNFQTKEQYKSTLNYHKILEMFIDTPIKLEIENKLSLLRIIKKFAFNPNFIQLEEWTKIYKAIINNLGVKEVALQRLVKQKQEEKKNGKITVHLVSKEKHQKPQYRTRRIKTEASIPQPRQASLASIDNIANQYQSQKNIQYMSSKSAIRPIEPLSKNQPKSYNPNQYRSRHKKLLTDVSEVFLKNVKKDLRSEKMIGLNDSLKKDDKNVSQISGEQLRNEQSYLKKAINNKKLGKITWQTLFEMKEETMYHNIVIPEFAKNLDRQN